MLGSNPMNFKSLLTLIFVGIGGEIGPSGAELGIDTFGILRIVEP